MALHFCRNSPETLSRLHVGRCFACGEAETVAQRVRAPLVSAADIRFLSAVCSPTLPQGAGYGNIQRGLNKTSAARCPAKSATMNTHRRRCARAGSPQYRASMRRQAVSARLPRTIPACDQIPLLYYPHGLIEQTGFAARQTSTVTDGGQVLTRGTTGDDIHGRDFTPVNPCDISKMAHIWKMTACNGYGCFFNFTCPHRYNAATRRCKGKHPDTIKEAALGAHTAGPLVISRSHTIRTVSSRRLSSDPGKAIAMLLRV